MYEPMLWGIFYPAMGVAGQSARIEGKAFLTTSDMCASMERAGSKSIHNPKLQTQSFMGSGTPSRLGKFPYNQSNDPSSIMISFSSEFSFRFLALLFVQSFIEVRQCLWTCRASPADEEIKRELCVIHILMTMNKSPYAFSKQFHMAIKMIGEPDNPWGTPWQMSKWRTPHSPKVYHLKSILLEGLEPPTNGALKC